MGTENKRLLPLNKLKKIEKGQIFRFTIGYEKLVEREYISVSPY